MVANVTDTVSENHVRVRRLRKIRDRIGFASACCMSNIEVLNSIRKSRETSPRDMHPGSLSTAETVINGYIRNTKALQDAVDNTIELVSLVLTSISLQ